MKFWMIGILTICFLAASSLPALAAPKTIMMKGNNITSSGSPLASSTSIKFYVNGTEKSAHDVDDQLAVLSITSGTLSEMTIKIDCVPDDTISALIEGNGFYAVKSLSMSLPNFENSTLTWDWSNTKVDLSASAPPTPSIGSITESSVKVGGGQPALQLTVPVSPGATPKVEKTTYRVKIWNKSLSEPGDDANGFTVLDVGPFNASESTLLPPSSSITFQNNDANPKYFQAGNTYSIKAAAYNDFNNDGTKDFCDPWATTADYTIAGSPSELSYLLTLESGLPGKPGINFIAMPFPKPWYAYKEDGTQLQNGLEITNALQLVQAVNEAKGPNIVSTFGYWDAVNQADAGVIIPDKDPTKANLGFNLEQGVGYQLYVTQPVKLVIKNQAPAQP